MMLSSLPPEILDLIVNHLHDEPATLKTCCVVSKSWVPRTRQHLFACVEFYNLKSHIEQWKKAFPDPFNSPAHHTHTLSVYGTSITTADAGWIRPFHNVVHLKLSRLDTTSLIPFYGLSPTVRSLNLTYTTCNALDLIRSFPLLEDLSLGTFFPTTGVDGWNTHLTSPKLTGTLDLGTFEGICLITRRLLDLPGALRFSEINTLFFNENAKLVSDLVSRCSDTLEFLTVRYHPQCAFPSASVISQHLTVARIATPDPLLLDLSIAAKLKYLGFLRKGSSVRWISTTLQTVKSKSFQRISIFQFDPITVEESVCQEWRDLDRLLVRFWTSHSIRPQVVYIAWPGQKDLKDHAPSLLPELTRRGLVDLVEAIG